MTYQITTATKKIAKLQKRIRAVQGGTGASKTISILIGLNEFAQHDKQPTLTSIVSESIPHLKKGCIRDFQNILKAHNVWREKAWNKTDNTYTYENGSQIEFFGADQAEKLRGGRRDRLFINEANNVSFPSFEELEVRTRQFVYLDWNPVSEFWFNEDVIGKRDDVDHIILTYKDNEALDKQTIASIEQRKNRPGWWKVYGLGELGEVEGKVYTGWQIIESVPHEARLERYGLDFGYTNDPTAIVAVYAHNGGYILDEITFQKGLQNKQIADIFDSIDKSIVIADSAEPKSIDEIKSYGVSILPSKKGGDRKRQEIQFVQGLRISVTRRSINIIKEYRNYLFEVDRNGKVTNEPEHPFSHSMDAIRYAIGSMRPYQMSQEKEEDYAIYSKQTYD